MSGRNEEETVKAGGCVKGMRERGLTDTHGEGLQRRESGVKGEGIGMTRG